MSKFHVEVFLPCTGQSYDVLIPSEVSMTEVTVLIAQTLSELAEGAYCYAGKAILCDRTSGKPLFGNISPREHGISNGAQLMLI